jgi:predicted site-specific integrase-resolvase
MTDSDANSDAANAAVSALFARHLNQEQLARRWSLSARTLERWRSDGKGPCYLRLGGRVAYRLEDIEAFEKAGRRVPS